MARTQFQHPREGLDHIRTGLDIQRSVGNALGEFYALFGAAIAHLRLRALAEGRTTAEEALAKARDLDEPVPEAGALQLLAWALYELSELQEADSRVEQAVAIYRRYGHQANELEALADVLRNQKELGQLEKAFATARYTITLVTELDEHLIVAACFLEARRSA